MKILEDNVAVRGVDDMVRLEKEPSEEEKCKEEEQPHPERCSPSLRMAPLFHLITSSRLIYLLFLRPDEFSFGWGSTPLSAVDTFFLSEPFLLRATPLKRRKRRIPAAVARLKSIPLVKDAGQ